MRGRLVIGAWVLAALTAGACGGGHDARRADTRTSEDEFATFCRNNPGTCSAQDLRTPSVTTEDPLPRPRVPLVYGVAFTDRRHGIAAVDRCADPECAQPMVTSDGGRSWQRSRIPDGGGLQVLAQPGGVRFAARRRAVYRSADGGRSWRRTAVRGLVNGVAARATGAWAVTRVGRRAWLWRSGDAGRSWSHRVLRDASVGDERTSVAAITFADAADGALSYLDRRDRIVLLITRDGGRRWTRRRDPCDGYTWLGAALSFSPDGALWAGCGGQPGAGDQAHLILVSADYGAHFSVRARNTFGGPDIGAISRSGYLDPGALDATSARDATLILYRGGVFATHDGGRHWRLLNGLPPGDLTQARQVSSPARSERWLAYGSFGLYHQRAGRWRRADLSAR